MNDDSGNEATGQSEGGDAEAAKTDAGAQDAKTKDAKTKGGKNADPVRSAATQTGFVKYVTTEKHSIPIDVQIKGEVISGQWSVRTGFVEFDVPSRLVEGFEMHHHFKMGNVVRAADKAAEKTNK